MYKITINGKHQHSAEPKENNSWLLDDKETEIDIIQTRDGSFHMLKNDKSYNIELIKFDREEKSLSVKVNGNRYDLIIKDKYDALLHSLGMDNANKAKVENIKAPMPGLVLNILVEEGREVKKGDALLVLEAMKMENILKSPADGTVKKVVVKKGTAVEKNQVLIHF